MVNGSNNFVVWKKGYWCTMVYKMKKSEIKKNKKKIKEEEEEGREVERHKPRMVHPALGIN